MDKNDGDNLKGLIVGNPESGVYPQLVLWSHINITTYLDENGNLRDGFKFEPDYSANPKIVGFSIVPVRKTEGGGK